MKQLQFLNGQNNVQNGKKSGNKVHEKRSTSITIDYFKQILVRASIALSGKIRKRDNTFSWADLPSE